MFDPFSTSEQREANALFQTRSFTELYGTFMSMMCDIVYPFTLVPGLAYMVLSYAKIDEEYLLWYASQLRTDTVQTPDMPYWHVYIARSANNLTILTRNLGTSNKAVEIGDRRLLDLLLANNTTDLGNYILRGVDGNPPFNGAHRFVREIGEAGFASILVRVKLLLLKLRE